MPAGVGTVVVVLGVGWLLTMLGGSDGGGAAPSEPGGGTGGGGTGGGGSGGGGGGSKGAADVPKAPAPPTSIVPADVPRNPTHLGGGGVWGDESKVPADFNWNGNGWWSSNDCGTVAIGRGFAPENFTLAGSATRQQITTLQSVTVLVPGPVAETGTLWNFLFHLGFDLSIGIAPGGGVLPKDAADRVLKEINPFCFEMGSWPDGFDEAVLADVTTFYVDQFEGLEGE
jgi:hypothetical protein